MGFINYNGKIQLNTVSLTTNNRAFRYGDGLFESLRYFNGHIPFLKEHIERLYRGMKILGYHSCNCLREEKALTLITTLCKYNKIQDSARIRITVYREDGGLYAPENDYFNFIIETSLLKDVDYKLNAKGLIIGISKAVQKPINQLSEIKTANALLMVLAAREAKHIGWDDALLINDKGNIAEATSSNLFIVKGQTIYTPPVEDGAMDGIMRRQIAHIIKQSDYKLCVESLNEADLEAADEIFLTNAVKGIIWVVGYGKKRYFNKAAKKLVLLLNKYVQELIALPASTE